MRLIALAVGALTFLFIGLESLQFQVSRTESQINMTGNAGLAFNTSEAVLADVTNTLGVSVPGFFLAALCALLAAFLWVTLQ